MKILDKLKEWYPLQDYHKDGRIFIGSESALIVGPLGFGVWWVNPDYTNGYKRFKENEEIGITYYNEDYMGLSVGLTEPMKVSINMLDCFKGIKKYKNE